MKYEDWARNAKNYGGEEKMEYFEDSHRSAYGGAMPDYTQTPTMKQTSMFTQKVMNTPYFQNVVVYEPRTPEDVQLIIDYLRQHEPAVVNLDNVEPVAAQRILDFVSGATYALCGSVHRIAGNIFLLSPEGVGITVPYESK